MDLLRKWWIFLLAALLLFAGLGSSGLWDPAEIDLADRARAVAEANQAKPPPAQTSLSLATYIVAGSLRVFGINEWAGRLPFAVCSFLTLVLLFYMTSRLDGPVPARIGIFVLLTWPAWLLQSRQMVGDTPFYLFSLALVAGLALEVATGDAAADRRGGAATRFLPFGLAALGAFCAALDKGLLLGVLFPVTSVLLALVLTQHGSTPLTPSPTRRLIPILLVVSGAALAAVALLKQEVHLGVILWGSKPHPAGGNLPSFEVPLRDLGFGGFPWLGLVPISLAVLLTGALSGHREAGSQTVSSVSTRCFLRHIALLSIVLGYLASAFWPTYAHTLRFPALPWLALAIGTLVAHPSMTKRRYPLFALIAAGLVLVLIQDFRAAPGSLAFSHLGTSAKYPTTVSVKWFLRGAGLLFALLFYFALAGPPMLGLRSIARLRRWQNKGARYWRQPLRAAIEWTLLRPSLLLARAIRWLMAAPGQGGPALTPSSRTVLATGVLAALFAAFCIGYWIPKLSHHMSNKNLFSSYHACKGPQSPLAQYQVAGQGAAYYNNGVIEDIKDQSTLFKRLRQPKPLFVLIPASKLGALDHAARQQKIPYYVANSNSQYVIAMNQLNEPCAEDKNPLRKLVVSKLPKQPDHKVKVNFENRVHLIGYDTPDVAWRGQSFKITLYFKVVGRLPAGYKLFIHFDNAGGRFHGDHEPLGGKYPTQYWLVNDYVVDPHEVDLPFLTTRRGRYKIFAGFWLGSRRLKIVEGPNDGHNRAKLGQIRVR